MVRYQQALRLEPDSPEAQNNLGIVLAKQGRLDEAAACYQQALHLKAEYPDAHNNLGNVLEKQDKLDEAMVRFGVQRRPQLPNLHWRW